MFQPAYREFIALAGSLRKTLQVCYTSNKLTIAVARVRVQAVLWSPVLPCHCEICISLILYYDLWIKMLMPKKFLPFTHNGIISGPLHLLLRLPGVCMTCKVPGTVLIEVQPWGILMQAALFKKQHRLFKSFSISPHSYKISLHKEGTQTHCPYNCV